jgi:hypothetical protein
VVATLEAAQQSLEKGGVQVEVEAMPPGGGGGGAGAMSQ